MAKRPTRAKKVARMRKAMRNTPPAYMDLVRFLQDHRYADTAGQAEKIILAGRVKVDSHVMGIGKGMAPKASARLKLVLGHELKPEDFEEVDTVMRHIDAKHRFSLVVLPEQPA